MVCVKPTRLLYHIVACTLGSASCSMTRVCILFADRAAALGFLTQAGQRCAEIALRPGAWSEAWLSPDNVALLRKQIRRRIIDAMLQQVRELHPFLLDSASLPNMEQHNLQRGKAVQLVEATLMTCQVHVMCGAFDLS